MVEHLMVSAALACLCAETKGQIISAVEGQNFTIDMTDVETDWMPDILQSAELRSAVLHQYANDIRDAFQQWDDTQPFLVDLYLPQLSGNRDYKVHIHLNASFYPVSSTVYPLTVYSVRQALLGHSQRVSKIVARVRHGGNAARETLRWTEIVVQEIIDPERVRQTLLGFLFWWLLKTTIIAVAGYVAVSYVVRRTVERLREILPGAQQQTAEPDKMLEQQTDLACDKSTCSSSCTPPPEEPEHRRYSSEDDELSSGCESSDSAGSSTQGTQTQSEELKITPVVTENICSAEVRVVEPWKFR